MVKQPKKPRSKSVRRTDKKMPPKPQVEEKKIKVMFLSEMCVLDKKSGAAIEMNAWLDLLQKSGFSCSSVTMSLFDGQEEYPFRKEVAPKIDPQEHIGKRLRVHRDGVEHNIVITGSSIGKNLKKEQIAGFLKSAREDIERIRPDVVIGYGSANLNPLRRVVRSLGGRPVFYLANGSYDEKKRACFEEVDEIIVPSAALQEFYKDTLGLTSTVEPNLVEQYIDPDTFSVEKKTAERGQGFITLINPDPLKGGLIFLQIAQLALREAPELTFLAVESRGTREMWEKAGLNIGALSNIWWIPKQKEIRRVFDRTSVLLVPSIWFEAAGRVVPEAQLCGIPVLANRRGGLPSQLNGAGYLFDIPERLQEKPTVVPTFDEVRPWLETIRNLMDNTDVYKASSEKALECSEPFRPDVRHRQIVDLFNRLAAQ